MSFRAKILSFVEVLLRVPPLFLIDEILKVGLGISKIVEQDVPEQVVPEQDVHVPELNKITTSYFNNYSSGYITNDPLFYRYIFLYLTRLTLGLLGEFHCH